MAILFLFDFFRLTSSHVDFCVNFRSWFGFAQMFGLSSAGKFFEKTENLVRTRFFVFVTCFTAMSYAKCPNGKYLKNLENARKRLFLGVVGDG